MSEQKPRVQLHIGGPDDLVVWATIDRVKGQVFDGGPYGPREDSLMVRLSFDQAVEGTSAFPVYLPALPYGKEAFLEAVKQEGEKALAALARERGEERAEQAQREERQRNLDRMAEGVRAAIGLE